MSAFDPQRFKALNASGWGQDLRALERCASTQDELRRDAAQGREGSVCVAEAQAAGRGRWGRRWDGRPGQSLLFSVLLKADAGVANAASLPLLLGLASARALRGLGLAEIGIKWPNDLLWRDRKLGGLLVEQEGGCWIAGCGLNVGQSQAELPALDPLPASLALAGLSVEREALLAALLGAWQTALRDWRSHGFAAAAADWPGFDRLQGRTVRALRGAEPLTGRVLGVDDDGRLRVAPEQGPEARLSSAEIELVRPLGPD